MALGGTSKGAAATAPQPKGRRPPAGNGTRGIFALRPTCWKAGRQVRAHTDLNIALVEESEKLRPGKQKGLHGATVSFAHVQVHA